jgi:hypothetical protein
MHSLKKTASTEEQSTHLKTRITAAPVKGKQSTAVFFDECILTPEDGQLWPKHVMKKHFHFCLFSF